MLTAVVRSTKAELEKKLQAYNLGSLARDAKVRTVPGMQGCIAIQHPQLLKMGADGIFDLCRFAGIGLEFTTDAPEIK